jgi:hypothetical protein
MKSCCPRACNITVNALQGPTGPPGSSAPQTLSQTLTAGSTANTNINMNNYAIENVNGLSASGLITIEGNVLSGKTFIEFVPSFTSASVDWTLANLDYVYWCQNIVGAQTLLLPTLNLRIGQRITIRNDSSTVALTVDSGPGGLINRGTSFRTFTLNFRAVSILLCVDNSPAAPIWISLSAT